MTPLILACYLGRYEIVKYMLQNPTTDVNMGSDDSGFTPLGISCMNGYYEISELLLIKGAEVDKKNNLG
jgi:ankyrin repeat protein